MRQPPILNHVAARRRLAWIGLAALGCLPALAQARPAAGEPIYIIHISGSAPLAKVELLVTQGSEEWDVSADYDSIRCEIRCTWRRKRDEFGQTPLVPLRLAPKAVIRLYVDFASLPATVMVDPAGAAPPYATRDVSPPGKRYLFPREEFS